jgi:hypothetical protein
MRQIALLTALLANVCPLMAQAENDPVALVVSLMSGKPVALPANARQVLEALPWEALAYADTATLANVQGIEAERLQEAVPDVYQFSAGILSLTPYQQESSSNSSGPIEVYYRQIDRYIVLSASPNGEEIDRWSVHYLDENYLILDFGELRLFLSHP